MGNFFSSTPKIQVPTVSQDDIIKQRLANQSAANAIADQLGKEKQQQRDQFRGQSATGLKI